MASIGLKGFLLPNNFLDGGAMGVALLLEIITKIDLSFLIILVNFPFIVLGARQISFELNHPVTQAEIDKEYPKPGVTRRNTGYAVDFLLNSEPFYIGYDLFNFSKLWRALYLNLKILHRLIMLLIIHTY
jgi:hypothetical protein